ncbi:MAG: protease complex subunit PrcB family protein [Anaerolineae bacterium]|nr:protease complex subunit PrcB family protein [Anaerolineae bacterium]
MKHSELTTVLDDCLGRLRAGESLDACLSSYPQLANQLRPLLFTAVSLYHTPRPFVDSQARSAGLARMLVALENRQARLAAPVTTPSNNRRSWLPIRFAFQVATAVVLLLFAGSWLIALNRRANPGEEEPLITNTAVIISHSSSPTPMITPPTSLPAIVFTAQPLPTITETPINTPTPFLTPTSLPSTPPPPPTITATNTPFPSPHFETVEQGYHSYYSWTNQSEIMLFEPTLIQLQNQEAWANFWARHTAGHFPPPPMPTIDFQAESVFVLMNSVEATGGYMVEIRRLELNEGGFLVYADKYSPGPNCVVSAAITQPFHIVKTSRITQTPTLILTARVHDCTSP